MTTKHLIVDLGQHHQASILTAPAQIVPRYPPISETFLDSSKNWYQNATINEETARAIAEEIVKVARRREEDDAIADAELLLQRKSDPTRDAHE